ncbi:hypothetical protein Tco_0902767 [Tanacetum coccineum]
MSTSSSTPAILYDVAELLRNGLGLDSRRKKIPAFASHSEHLSCFDPIVANSSPTLIHLVESDFLLLRGSIMLSLALDDETTSQVELKDLPPHLVYASWNDATKDTSHIAIELVGGVSDLIKVLKVPQASHRLWNIIDIMGINPEFCTHKILMEEDYKPTVQHQRRVNPKIHDVIKKEVEKLLDARLIYPISDSPWCDVLHGKEALVISRLATMEPNGGIIGANLTAKKIFDSGFLLALHFLKVPQSFVNNSDSVPTTRKNSQRDEKPQTHQFVKSFGGRVFGVLTFGPVSVFTEEQIIFRGPLILVKWVEAEKQFPPNDARMSFANS